MITRIANKITCSLNRNNIISAEDRDIYVYGLEIFFSTLITIAIVISFGIIMNCLPASLIYFAVFAVSRQICGGYHADTYFKCNTIFAITTFLALSAYKYAPVEIEGSLHYMIMTFWIMSVFNFAPVENESKPISSDRRKKLRVISRGMCILMALVSCMIYIFRLQYTVLLDATIFFVAFAIVISGLQQKDSEKK
ncbi:MAG: accessory gene regulator ArgB-like protein [Porcipelethomonas sp.]